MTQLMSSKLLEEKVDRQLAELREFMQEKQIPKFLRSAFLSHFLEFCCIFWSFCCIFWSFCHIFWSFFLEFAPELCIFKRKTAENNAKNQEEITYLTNELDKLKRDIALEKDKSHGKNEETNDLKAKLEAQQIRMKTIVDENNLLSSVIKI